MHGRSIYWVALLALGLIVAPAVTQGQVVNLVQNPSFEQDEAILNDAAWDQWCTWGYDVGVNSTVKIDTSQAIDGIRSLRVDALGSTNWYFIVLYQPMPQKVGTKYTASFWLKGQAPRPFGAQFKDVGNTVNWGYTDFQITADWAEYHFTAAAQTASVKLELYCAGSEIPFWLDFVNVYEGDYVAGIKPSGATVPTKATGPTPADKATDVSYDTALGWTGTRFAATHDVYLGKTLADVNSASRTKPTSVLVSQGQTATTYTPAAALDFGQTYYWRVDEVNKAPDNTIFKGSLWSFTVEPYSYPIASVTATASSAQNGMGPENTVNGSGLTGDQHGTDSMTMWMSRGMLPNWIQYQFDAVYKLDKLLVWNSNQLVETYIGFGAKDVTVEYSVDGVTWTTLAGVPQFTQGTAAPTYTANTTVNFSGVLAKYVKLTINKTWGGLPTASLAEVRFYSIPVHARAPQPAAGATGMGVAATLNWRPGRDVTSQKVYFGMDPNAVAKGTVSAKIVTTHAFDPGTLTYGATYYWKVDEVGATSTYPGSVWSFTTQEFAVVDDFEGYDDKDNRIYDTWIDGMTDGKSGSVVGYLAAPFAEQTIIHGGKQSMPLAYDNSKTPFYSETTRDLGTAQDWTGNGATHMDLWFRGYPAATSFAITTTGGAMTLTGDGTDIWNSSDDFVYAYKTLTGDGSIVARVVSVGTGSNTWAKGGVMIRGSLNGGAAFADTVITGGAGNGASFQYRLTTNSSSPGSIDAATALAAPYWVKIERKGDIITGYISVNGATWSALGTPQTIPLTGPIYIGLCMTSHAAGEQRTFGFDNIATTGGVTGSWQGAQINSPQYNDPAGLYVVVEDSSGKNKLVAHPNPSAAATGVWTQWTIPLSDLTAAGVKTTKVQKLTIGAGDRSSPKAGAKGMLYIDDIGFGHPAQ